MVPIYYTVGCEITEGRKLSILCHQESNLSEVCGEESGTGAGFLRLLRFLFPILIPPHAPYSSSGGRYNKPISGGHTKWSQSYPTQPHEKKKISKPMTLYLETSRENMDLRETEFAGANMIHFSEPT
jgi:hypothetical protein